MSQARLAELMGVTRSACSQWERDAVNAPRDKHLSLLARLLGVSAEWLSTGRDAAPVRTREGTPAYAGRLSDDERELLRLYARLDADAREALLVLLRQRTKRRG